MGVEGVAVDVGAAADLRGRDLADGLFAHQLQEALAEDHLRVQDPAVRFCLLVIHGQLLPVHPSSRDGEQFVRLRSDCSILAPHQNVKRVDTGLQNATSRPQFQVKKAEKNLFILQPPFLAGQLLSTLLPVPPHIWAW